jgi:hypothetical protein
LPGVLRPYTLVDVLSTIYNQNGQGNTGSSATALTVPLSADETATMGDTAFAASQTNITWDQGVWSAGTWS